jgi:hypothetical protein
VVGADFSLAVPGLQATIVSSITNDAYRLRIEEKYDIGTGKTNSAIAHPLYWLSTVTHMPCSWDLIAASITCWALNPS